MKSSERFIAGGGWKTAFTFRKHVYTVLALVGFMFSLAITLLLYSFDVAYGRHVLWFCVALIPAEFALIVQAVRYSLAEKRALEKMKAPHEYNPRNFY